jgi:SPP1 gp7 family putative phage head morphogenesis protein
MLRSAATDAAGRGAKRRARQKSFERFQHARKAERRFAGQLTAVARHIGAMVGALAPGGLVKDPTILDLTLRRYGDVLRPWAREVSAQMLDDVAKRDAGAWAEHGREIGRELRQYIETTPTGELFRQLMAEQVDLITSLPIEAANRVHRLTQEAQLDSTRAAQIAREIERSGEVTASRARLIARTEVARTASHLTEARAAHIGSEGYIWRTSRDGAVRDSHREMQGKFVRWDTPPTLSDGTTTHAGQIYNCRCWPDPVLPE